jgi:hypothetical protein
MEIYGRQRYFGCVSIIGCEGVISEDYGHARLKSYIDRDEIVCQPLSFESIYDKEVFYGDLRKLHLEYLLSLGIRDQAKLSKLISQ